MAFTSRIVIDQVSYGGANATDTNITVTSQDAVLVVFTIATGASSTIGTVSFNGTNVPIIILNGGAGATTRTIRYLVNPAVGTYNVHSDAAGTTHDFLVMTLLGVSKTDLNPISYASPSTLIPPQAGSMVFWTSNVNDAPSDMEVTQIQGLPNMSIFYQIAEAGSFKGLLLKSGGIATAAIFTPARATSMWFPSIDERNLLDVVNSDGIDNATIIAAGNYGQFPSTFYKNSFLHTIGRIAGANAFELTNYVSQNPPYSSQIIIDQIYEVTPSTDSSGTFNINIPSQDASVVVLTAGGIVGGNGNSVTLNGAKISSSISQNSPDVATTNAEIFYIPNPPMGVDSLTVKTSATGLGAVVMVLLNVDKRALPVVGSTSGTAQGLQFQSVTPPTAGSLVIDFFSNTNSAAAGTPALTPKGDQITLLNTTDGIGNTYGASYRMVNGNQNFSWSTLGGNQWAWVTISLAPAQAPSYWFPNTDFRVLEDTTKTTGLNTSTPTTKLSQFGNKPANFYKNSFLHTVGRMGSGSFSSGPYGILSSANTQSRIIFSNISHGVTNQSNPINHSIPSNDAILLVFVGTSTSDPTNVKFNDTNLTELSSVNCADGGGTNRFRSIWYSANPPVGTYSVNVVGSGSVDGICAITLLGVNKKKLSPLIFSASQNTNQGGLKATLSVYPDSANSMVIDQVQMYTSGGSIKDLLPNYNQTPIILNDLTSIQNISFIISGRGENTLSWDQTQRSGGSTPNSNSNWTYQAIVLEPDNSYSLWRPSINLRNSLDLVGTTDLDSPWNAVGNSIKNYGYFPANFYKNSFLHTVGRINVIPIVVVQTTPAETEQPTSQIIVDKIFQGQTSGATTLNMDVNIPSQDACLVVTGGSVIATGGAWQAVTYNGTALTKLVGTVTVGADAEIWYLPNPPVGTGVLSIIPTAVTGEVYANAMVILGVDKTNVNIISTSTSDAASTSTIATQITPDVDNCLIIDCLATLDATAAPKPDVSQTQVFNATALASNEYVISTYKLGSNSQQQMNYNLSASVNASLVAIALRPAYAPSLWYPNIDQRTIDDTVTVAGLDAEINPAFGQYGYKPSTFYKNSFLHTVGRMFGVAPGAIIGTPWMVPVSQPYPDKYGISSY